MNIDVCRFRTQGASFLCFTIAALSLSLPLIAQSIQPIQENGRVVWTNDTPGDSGFAASADRSDSADSAKPVAPTELVYWSNTEKRWKPIRTASPRAMKSARTVASEVNSYIESHAAVEGKPTSTEVKGELAAGNPNDSQVAGNRGLKLPVSTAQIDKYIEEAAARHHVDPNLVRALIKVESNFNPHAVSRKGAMGLMQLMPATARRYDVRNPFDAAQNVDAGVRHLKGLLENFGGDVRLTLAAYNAGEGAVMRSRGIPPYTETRNYVKRITGLMAGGSEPSPHMAAVSLPVTLRRDEAGRLIISNTD